MKIKYTYAIAAALLCALAVTPTAAQSADPLPSWNDGKAKQAILTFVSKGTKEGSPEFVPPAERIATFAFLRGAAEVMAWDLSHTPVTGIQVMIDGDAHVNNFGPYGTPQGRRHH